MNLEIQYPELKTMKSSEIFIEWAYIVENFVLVNKIHVRRIIPKKEKTIFVKALKLEYGVSPSPDVYEDGYLVKFKRVELVTIEK